MTASQPFAPREPDSDFFLDKLAWQRKIAFITVVEVGAASWGVTSLPWPAPRQWRFIYHHPRDWYLTAFNKSDTITPARRDGIDAAGWDVTKCLRLLFKGNVQVHECLGSTAVLREAPEKLQALRTLAEAVFNPYAACNHYRALAQKQLHRGEDARNLFYALRHAGCARWVAQHLAAPPASLDALFAHRALPCAPAALLGDRGEEAAAVLAPWLTRELQSLREARVPARHETDTRRYDAVLQQVLRDEVSSAGSQF